MNRVGPLLDVWREMGLPKPDRAWLGVLGRKANELAKEKDWDEVQATWRNWCKAVRTRELKGYSPLETGSPINFATYYDEYTPERKHWEAVSDEMERQLRKNHRQAMRREGEGEPTHVSSLLSDMGHSK